MKQRECETIESHLRTFLAGIKRSQVFQLEENMRNIKKKESWFHDISLGF